MEISLQYCNRHTVLLRQYLIYALLVKMDTEIPDDIIKEIARCLLPDIVSYCESEAGNAEFERWKAQQSEMQKSKAG